MVESVTKVLKVHQRAFPRDKPVYMGMSFTRDSCPKSTRRIMEKPPKGIVHWEGKDSRKRAPIWVNKFGPLKLISSMRMYQIWRSSS